MSNLKNAHDRFHDPCLIKKIQKQKTSLKLESHLAQNKNMHKIILSSQVWHLKNNEKLPLRKIAENLNVTIGKVTYIARMLKKGKGSSLISTIEKIDESILIQENFPTLVRELVSGDGNNTKSVKSLYNEFIEQNPSIPIRNVAQFYRLLKAERFKYRPFVLKKPSAHKWSEDQTEFTNILLAEVITNKKEFAIFWVDESAICPQNFQRKAWTYLKKQPVVISKLKYEKVKILGMMSSSGIHSLQFIQGSNSQIIFDDFIIQSLKKFFRESDGYQTPVIFLDNSPIHKSSRLLAFCKKNGVFLIFNIICNPCANAIEVLWRYLKIPFKRITYATRYYTN